MLGKALNTVFYLQLVVLAALAPIILAEFLPVTPHRRDLSENLGRHSHSLVKLQKRIRRIAFAPGTLPAIDESAPLEPKQAQVRELDTEALRRQRALIRGRFIPKPITSFPQLTQKEAKALRAAQTSAGKTLWFSNFRMPWSRSPPSFSTFQMNKLLRDPLPPLYGRNGPLLSPAKVGNEAYEAVKLPGNGWDAHTVQQMYNKGKPYFVQGAFGRVWLQHPGSEESTKFVRVYDKTMVATVRHAIENHAYPTVETPAYAFTKAKSGGSWLSRLTEGAKGWLGQASNAVKYLRGP